MCRAAGPLARLPGVPPSAPRAAETASSGTHFSWEGLLRHHFWTARRPGTEPPGGAAAGYLPALHRQTPGQRSPLSLSSPQAAAPASCAARLLRTRGKSMPTSTLSQAVQCLQVPVWNWQLPLPPPLAAQQRCLAASVHLVSVPSRGAIQRMVLNWSEDPAPCLLAQAAGAAAPPLYHSPGLGDRVCGGLSIETLQRRSQAEPAP